MVSLIKPFVKQILRDCDKQSRGAFFLFGPICPKTIDKKINKMDEKMVIDFIFHKSFQSYKELSSYVSVSPSKNFRAFWQGKDNLLRHMVGKYFGASKYFLISCYADRLDMDYFPYPIGFDQLDNKEKRFTLQLGMRLASFGGQFIILDELIGKYFQPWSQSKNGNISKKFLNTCLRDACLGGHTKTVQLLLKYGANARANNDAALLMAVKGKNAAIIKLLVDNGCSINAHDGAVRVFAEKSGDVELLKWYQKNTNHTFEFTECKLLRAIDKAHYDYFKFCVDMKCNFGNMDLHDGVLKICKRGDRGFLKFLLANGLTLNPAKKHQYFYNAWVSGDEKLMELIAESDEGIRAILERLFLDEIHKFSDVCDALPLKMLFCLDDGFVNKNIEEMIYHTSRGVFEFLVEKSEKKHELFKAVAGVCEKSSPEYVLDDVLCTLMHYGAYECKTFIKKCNIYCDRRKIFQTEKDNEEYIQEYCESANLNE